jgi:LytS/YehU family sensor histidine kinase
MPASALDLRLPSFALQTLVENAVRHGATPKLGGTRLRITAKHSGQQLRLVVSDDGAGADAAAIRDSSGTGLRRLRERLACLYGNSAALEVDASPAGVTASLRLPLMQDNPREDGDDD